MLRTMIQFPTALVRWGFLLSACAISVFSLAQQNPTPANDVASTTIRSQTELVLVPVAVTDKSGAHVANLRLKDFEVTENGKPQQVTLFEEIIARGPSQHPQKANEFTNFVDDQSARRLTIILLDLLNTPYLSQQNARLELLKVLSTGLNDGDPKALLALTRSGIVVVHDFTTDPAVLAAALRTTKGDPGTPAGVDANSLALEVARLSSFGMNGETSWDFVRQRSSIDKTVESLQALAKAFAGLPGRKTLIWASAGFPLMWGAGPIQFRQPYPGSAPPRQAPGGAYPGTPSLSTYEKTYQMFNAANIAIYSVDIRGLVNEMYPDASIPGDPSAYFRWANAYHEAITTTLINFAEETGGKAFVGFSNVGDAFRQALDESRSYYLLGYYLNRANSKPGWHKLRVRVARSSAEVRTRAGFMVPESPGRDTDDTQLALTSPLNYTAVPLTLRLEGTTDVSGKMQVEFTLKFAPGGFTIDSTNGNHAWLEITAGIVDAKGAVKATKTQTLDLHLKHESVAKILASGLAYRGSFDVSPGEYTGRIAVRDRLSGRVGSVSAPLHLIP